MLPEVRGEREGDGSLKKEYGSSDKLLDLEGTRELLRKRKLMLEDVDSFEKELLR
jgi:hypothetical protein